MDTQVDIGTQRASDVESTLVGSNTNKRTTPKNKIVDPVDQAIARVGAPVLGVRGNNQRREHRYPARWPVTGKLPNGKVFTATTENISPSGVLFATQARLKVGMRAHIVMETYIHGKKRLLDAIVEIRHVSLSGDDIRCGCLVLKTTDSNKRFIERYAAGKNPHVNVTDSGTPTSGS